MPAETNSRVDPDQFMGIDGTPLSIFAFIGFVELFTSEGPHGNQLWRNLLSNTYNR